MGMYARQIWMISWILQGNTERSPHPLLVDPYSIICNQGTQRFSSTGGKNIESTVTIAADQGGET